MDTKKFHKEIRALKLLNGLGGGLHPLVQQQIKQRLLAAVSSQTETPARALRFAWQERSARLMRYLIATFLGVVLVGGTVYGSNNAKPGDLLFPVKKAKETVELSFTASTEAKAELQTRFANERLKELEQINNQTQVNTQAQTQAETEVSSALNVLNEVRVKLEAKGNATAAAAVGETVEKLQKKFSQQKRELEAEGLIQKTDQGFAAKIGGQSHQISNQVDLSAFADKSVKIEGRLQQNGQLFIQELKLGGIKVKSLGNNQIKTEIKAATLARIAEGFGIYAEGITFKLQINPEAAAILSSLSGEKVDIEGFLNGLILMPLKIEAENETESKQETQSRRTEEDGRQNENKEQKSIGEVEIKGTLKLQGNQMVVEANGLTYVLAGVNLKQYAGKSINIHGTLNGNLLTVTEFELLENERQSQDDNAQFNLRLNNFFRLN